MTKEITKFPEHYEVAKPKYTVVDLEQQKIVKTVDITKEEEPQNQGDYGVGWIEISPDGKYLYQFGEKITILQASGFQSGRSHRSGKAGRSRDGERPFRQRSRI